MNWLLYVASTTQLDPYPSASKFGPLYIVESDVNMLSQIVLFAIVPDTLSVIPD